MSIRLIQYANSLVTPRDDAVLYDELARKGFGIIHGIEFSLGGGNLVNVTSGYALIGGRVIAVEAQSIPIDLSRVTSSQAWRISIHVNLNDGGNPVEFVGQANVDGLPPATNIPTDLNYINGEAWLQVAHGTCDANGVQTIASGYSLYESTIRTKDVLDADDNTLDEIVADLKKSVADGKALIASAETAKGVQTASNATFQTLANNVAKVYDKAKVGTAVAANVLTGKTFTNSSGVGLSGAMPNKGAWTSAPATKGQVTVPEGYHSGSGYVDTNKVYLAGVKAAPTTVFNYNGKCRGNLDTIDKTESYTVGADGAVDVTLIASSCDFGHSGSVTITFYINDTAKLTCTSSSTTDYTVNSTTKTAKYNVTAGQVIKYTVVRNSTTGKQNPLYAAVIAKLGTA